MTYNLLNLLKTYVFIGIVGSRKRSEEEEIIKILKNERDRYKNIIVVSGGANGIDDDVQWACKKLGLPILIFYPKVEEYNVKRNNIYSERNEDIAKISNYLHAFPLNKSGGTMNTIGHFVTLGKKDKLKIYD